MPLWRRSTVAAIGFVLLAVAGKAVEAAASATWDWVADRQGQLLATVVIAGAIAIASVLAGLLGGHLKLPARNVQTWIVWVARQAPFSVLDLIHRRSISLGRRNTRWGSEVDFEAENPRRASRDHDQTDYGKHWRGHDVRYARVTHVEATNEVVAVGERNGSEFVELLASGLSESKVDQLLTDWAYASMGSHDLRWVRYRLRGWNVPLPPRGKWWQDFDSQPNLPWPAPPPPSLEFESGAYHGHHGDHGDYEVLSVDSRGPRSLYHAVEDSPTGMSWGYAGAGPSDLARSMLLDRLGYVPNPATVATFRDDIVGGLADRFVLTYEQVDAWIDEHRPLIAEDPRAQLLDPLAAGGADRD